MAAVPPVFNATVDECTACFASTTQRMTLLAVGFAWSATSRELLAAVRECEAGLSDVDCRYLDGDAALEYCTKNNIVAGAGGLKLFDKGREVCLRLRTGFVTYTVTALLRASQIAELVRLVAEAQRVDAIASLPF